MDNKDKFHYTYSAKQQEEIKQIRKKYAPVEEPEDKMMRLRKLDASVHQKATILSLAAGIPGALLLGIGMSLIMTDFAVILGPLQGFAMGIGIVIGIIGLIPMCLAYTIYSYTIKKEREKIAPEVLRLTEELMK